MYTKIGKFTIIIAFIVSLYPYMFVFTWPVILIGIILIWLGDQKTIRKIIWTLAPIGLWYPVMQLVYFLLARIN